MKTHAITFLVCAIGALGGLPARAADVVAEFAEARPEFSPVPIWWWSGDRVERDRIREQLERIAAGGIHNAIVLNLAPSGPLYGSAADEPPFLSDEWWDLFAYTVQEGERVGVRLWFYDQLGFSGAGLQARVVRDHPEARSVDQVTGPDGKTMIVHLREQESFRGVELRREFRDVIGPTSVEIPVPPDGESLAAFVAQLVSADANEPQAQWIWDGAALQVVGKRYFRRTFDLSGVPSRATLRVTADNGYVAYVNGHKLGGESMYGEQGWSRAESFDVRSWLRAGRNAIAVEGENLGGPAGLLLELVLGDDASPAATKAASGPAKRASSRIVSDAQFRVSATPADGWTGAAFDDSAWAPARAIGAPPIAPWGAVAGIGGDDDSLGVRIAGVRTVTDAIADGRLRVDVPAGPHRVQLFYTVPGGFDYHNPRACAALLDVVHGEMERRFGDALGKEIAGSFQDEFPPIPRFSRQLPAEFSKRRGYDLLARLPALYDDVVDRFGDADGPTAVQIRCDANRVAAELAEDAFFRPLYEWHERHGMLCGYDQTVRNADPIGGERYYVDYFATMRHYSVPGNDQSGDAKPHESIADLYERPRVWLEGFHSSGWGQTLEEIATLLHAWMAEGSTLYNPHAIYYSTHGSFYEWAPPDTGWRQPYFAHYPALADYVSRLCYALTRGRHVADVAVVHPAATVHAYSGFGPPQPVALRASELYWGAQRNLRAERVDYIVIDEDSIGRSTVRDGVMEVGRARLRALVLPSVRVIGGAALERMVELAESGGSVFVLGAPPAEEADASANAATFAALRERLMARAIRLDDASRVAPAVVKRVGRDVIAPAPALHRRLADRDLYFVLSDGGTTATWSAQFDINGRRLWETPAAQGARLALDVRGDGVPERWDALTGAVTPILNYRRAGERTRVDVDLASTPAPLVALRPAGANDPTVIESDLQIVEWRRAADGDAIVVRGWTRLDDTAPPPLEHRARLEQSGAAYEGSRPASPPVRVDVSGPFACRLEPTCDNRRGDFAWPPSDGPIPVEVRAMRYHEDDVGQDTAAWRRADFDDSGWDTVLASYGPRATWIGPMPVPEGQTFETMKRPAGVAGQVHTAEYSLRLGIDEDPVYPSALGGKGRIPEEFIDLGDARAGDVYAVSAVVHVPPAALEKRESVGAVLRIGGAARKRAFLNDEEVRFGGDAAARVRSAPVTLRAGDNRLELLASRVSGGRLRLFYHFLPADRVVPDPQWIWSASPSPTGRVTFAKAIDVPGEVKRAGMVVALGDLHRIELNGQLVADQGNFDPYFTGRSERYDISTFVRRGRNTLVIEARDPGAPVGLLLDGLVESTLGDSVPFVSDSSFATAPAGAEGAKSEPARILAGPAHGYFGETATLLLRPRPHPLPLAGWLLDQAPPPAPFDQFVFSTGRDRALAGWYRFRVPPGAPAMRIPARGRVEAYVNGERLEVERQTDGDVIAALPGSDSPRRVAVLRIENAPGFERGAALDGPITFQVGPGRVDLGSWDELGLSHYSGGVHYETDVTLEPRAGRRLVLDLGHVRGSADVTVNGVACGVRLWHPYRFDITAAARAGANHIDVRVLNTLGPHFGVGHPSAHVQPNHTKSGLFGPVSVRAVEEVELRLERKTEPAR